ncbi:glycosyl transferase family 1 [Novosphingobium fuchskuhlense]|uniref:Glycosyl transferase family 1 n=1 Tax=Novosphingobium fuchskuhlense TaxID=1117702 RepID=A0A117UY08_9SPHN|nr:glycosyltransferase family 4 protein [Novosphingobium fuchskuhlense]KUR72927.1 glycosyl transferase family 1 [Novosphingobium fuchskuhlense]
MSKTAPGTRLHLLHLHSTFDAGGKERRSTSLINRFGKAVDHSIVSAQPGALGARAQIDPGLSVHFPFGFPPLAGRFGVRRLQTLARAMQGFDLILTYNWGAMDAAMAHAMFAPTLGLAPLIHHEDGFNADEAHKLKTSRNWYRRVALARASALIVPSRQLERVALDVWHQPAARVQRIGNGIPVKDYDPAKARKVRPDALPRVVKRPGEKWVGTLAGLRPVKALPRLVRAFRGLPEEWQLVIVGEGPEREAILAEALRLEIGHRVHLPGHVAKPAEATALFDLFALSSESEQFPLSVVEAMASGLAVASPAVGDVADIVASENAPFITPQGDEAALGAALLRLAEDEGLRRQVGAANQLRALQEYDEAAMARRHAAVYAAALGLPAFP